MTPIFLNFIYIIVGPFMVIKKVQNFVYEGHLNLIMNQVSHIIVIAIPMVISTSMLLLVMVVVHYFKLVFRFLMLLFIKNTKGETKSQFGDKIITLITFLFFGIFVLLFLWVRDIKMLILVLFDFRVTNIEKFWNKTYNTEEKQIYIKCLKDFITICEKFKKENKKYVKISEIIYTFKNDPKMQNFGYKNKESQEDSFAINKSKIQDQTLEIQKSNTIKKDDSPEMMDYILKKQAQDKQDREEWSRKEASSMMNKICQQFVSFQELSGCKGILNAKLEISLSLQILKEKMKRNGDVENVDSIINYSQSNLEMAKAVATFDEDAELKGEIKYMQNQLEDLKGMVSKLIPDSI